MVLADRRKEEGMIEKPFSPGVEATPILFQVRPPSVVRMQKTSPSLPLLRAAVMNMVRLRGPSTM